MDALLRRGYLVVRGLIMAVLRRPSPARLYLETSSGGEPAELYSPSQLALHILHRCSIIIISMLQVFLRPGPLAAAGRRKGCGYHYHLEPEPPPPSCGCLQNEEEENKEQWLVATAAVTEHDTGEKRDCLVCGMDI